MLPRPHGIAPEFMRVQTSPVRRRAQTTPRAQTQPAQLLRAAFRPTKLAQETRLLTNPRWSLTGHRQCTAHELKIQAPPSGASANTRRATTHQKNTKQWKAPSPAPPAASGRTSKRAATGSSPRRTAPAASRRASPSWPCPAATPSARTAFEGLEHGCSILRGGCGGTE